MGVSIIEGSKADRVATALELIAAAQVAGVETLDVKAIQQITRAGLASKFFNYGDQISPKWNPDGGATEYDYDMDVVAFLDAVNALGETKPAMWLQSHWGLPSVQYDASEAIWACAEPLEAGTYYFKFGDGLGKIVKNKVYQFTLGHGLPVGGQIVIGTADSFYIWDGEHSAVSDWRVYTFSSPKSVTPVDGPVVLTDITGETPTGTNLGTLSIRTKYSAVGGVLNSLHRAVMGYGRWSQCGVRQWLNSDKPAGQWWEPQNPFDRPPQQLATMRGFLAGLPADFLAIVQPVRVVSVLNRVTDSDIGESETTIDRFFLSSLEQEYISPQVSGVEGAYWPYWKERLGLSNPQATGNNGANANHTRYTIENHTSSQIVRLRTVHPDNAFASWTVRKEGYAYSYHAANAYRSVPACVIC